MTPLTPQQALAELRKYGGIQFDPDVVAAFVRTKWVTDVPDPGRPEIRDVPMIGKAAVEMTRSVSAATPDGEPGMTELPRTKPASA